MVTPHQQQLKHLLQLTKKRMLITELSEESMFPASETIDEKSSARAWTFDLIARPLRPKNEKRKNINSNWALLWRLWLELCPPIFVRAPK